MDVNLFGVKIVFLSFILCPETIRRFFIFLKLCNFFNFGDMYLFAVIGAIFTKVALCLSWAIDFLGMPKTAKFRFNCAVKSEGVPIRSAILDDMN